MDEGTLLGAGRYVVVSQLGEGAMGTVLLARRLEDGLDVAIKRLRDPRLTVRFEIEARLLSRLKHPRVASVLEHFAEDGESYMVMVLVSGETLWHVLQRDGRPGLPADVVVPWMQELCQALEYVHAQHVVHRDIKPSNLVLGEDGIVLVDFGIARELDDAESATIGVGTPSFMAPEVLVGGVVSARADVYGVAATLWTLLTGRPPRYGEPDRLSDIVPECGTHLDGPLRAGLALEPEARPPDAAAFAAALGAPVVGASGVSLVRTIERPRLPAAALAAITRAGAGILESTALSVAMADPPTGELVYEAAWGAGADQIVGVRLAPGTGIAGAVLASREPTLVPDCRTDPRFAEAVAARTGYIPHTMMVVPLRIANMPGAVMTALDRRDGRPFTDADLEIARHVADLVAVALASGTDDSTIMPTR